MSISSQLMNYGQQMMGFNSGLQGTNQNINTRLLPAYQDLLSGSGPLSSAATNATMGALGGSTDAATNQAKLAAARTNNGAALPDLLGQMARSRGMEAGQLAAQNRMSQAQTGMSGMSGMYAQNADLLGRTLGLPIQAGQAAAAASPWRSILGALGGAGSAAIGAFA